MPSINELASDDHLNISSSKIREQLEVAKSLGLVEVRSKIGTRVQEYSFAPAVRLSLFVALSQDDRLFESFSQLRTHVETAFWHEACDLLTDEVIKTMKQCIEQARQKLNSHPIRIPNSEHRRFHLSLFENLDNPFVHGILEAYWDAYDLISVNQYMDYEYLQQVWTFHEQILQAIRDQQFDVAQSLFVEHTTLLRYQPRMEAER